jgi:hypothetical protein
MSSIVRQHVPRGLLAPAVAAALVLVTVPASGASAAPPERFSSEPVTIERAEFCGIVATLTTSFRAVDFAPRPVKGSDGQAFYGHNRYAFTDVFSTDRGSFTIVGKGNSRESRATKVPGEVTYTYVDDAGVTRTVTSADVWTFTSRDSGIYRYYGSDGQLLLKGTGVYETRYQFDTLGDSQPGGRFVPGTFELVRNKTGNSFDEGEECAAAAGELL